jgi:rubrerythrin
MLFEKAVEGSQFNSYKCYNIIAADDNINNNNKSSTDNDNKRNTKNTASHQTHFLLCETCFWCATCLINSSGATAILNCPICNTTKIESLPVTVAP